MPELPTQRKRVYSDIHAGRVFCEDCGERADVYYEYERQHDNDDFIWGLQCLECSGLLNKKDAHHEDPPQPC